MIFPPKRQRYFNCFSKLCSISAYDCLPKSGIWSEDKKTEKPTEVKKTTQLKTESAPDEVKKVNGEAREGALGQTTADEEESPKTSSETEETQQVPETQEIKVDNPNVITISDIEIKKPIGM